MFNMRASTFFLHLLSALGSQGHPTTSSPHSKQLRANVGLDNASDPNMFVQKLLSETSGYREPAANAATNETFKVGIVGAGAAGLYAAVLLQSLGIDFEILEANTRIGGRIYTHRFDKDAWAKAKPGEPAYYNYYVSHLLSLSRAQMQIANS
jgi:NAD(P)-binding Rossmann-like domain